MSCVVGHRCSSDLALLWLWRRPAATAPIRPIAWEPPYAAGVAQKNGKKTKKKKKKRLNFLLTFYSSNIIECIHFSLYYWTGFSYRHSLFCCALLYCASQMPCFLKIEGLRNCALNKSISAIFPTAFAYFVSLWHVLVIFTVF